MSKVQTRTEQQPQQQGMKIEKLFEQFTKSNTVVANSFQLVYDGLKQLGEENARLTEEVAFLKGEKPRVETIPQPNRKTCRALEKIQKKVDKKNDKPAK